LGAAVFKARGGGASGRARSLLPWSHGIAPRPREDYRDIVMVAGEDPYAWKGVEEIAVPFVRPEDARQAEQVFARTGGRLT
jgi:hypothetical protein